MKNNKKNVVIFGSMRVPFLILTPTCVGIGAATAYYSGFELNILNLILVMIGAICAHISVNALNEYDDFKSGLDLKTEQTPFSGGSKTIPENPENANLALITGIISLVITVFIGLYFLFIKGMMILPIGILGILIILAYTKWITKSPILCLIAPGIGFGMLMVMGTHYVLTGEYSLTAFLASLIPTFLVSDLLLLNQFPDIEADKSIGRKHLPITIGKTGSKWLYSILILCTYIALVTGILLNYLPFQALLALIAAGLAVPTITGVIKHADSIPKLMPFMGMNVILIILTNILLITGLFLG